MLKIKLPNEGRQIPYKCHQGFIAQHATATCCSKCLMKWHTIPESKVLSDEEIYYFKDLIMLWINK